MTIATILFDFGGVIYQIPDLTWVIKLQDMLGITLEPDVVELLENPNESSLMRDICLGEISEDRIWVAVVERWRIKPRVFRHIRRKFISRRHCNKPLVRYLKKLGQSYKTGILSNAGLQTRSLMEDVFHLDRYVDDIIISAEEKLIKPDQRIYQVAMDRLDAEPETTLFLDDLPVNVEAARDLGMKAVQFLNTQQAILEINAILEGEG